MIVARALDDRPRGPLVLSLVLIVAIVACAIAMRPARRSLPNVVLVVVDTLRADSLGSYGAAVATPAIDAVAGAGLRYARAVAQAPWTIPSLSSLLTSQYPSQHGEGVRVSRSSGGTRTLAERLGTRGYTTAAFVEVDTPLFRRGFDSFDVATGTTEERYARAAEHASRATFERARTWLRGNADVPFFLFIHTYALHDYFLGTPPALAHAEARHPSYDGRLRTWRPRPVSEAAGPRIVDDLLASDAEDVAYAKALYEGALLDVDREIGAVDEVLAERGWSDDTIFVLTSDHGEGFAPELGRVHHGGRLHDDLLHVPLLLRWPAGIDPGVEETPVESIDVAPTILSLLSGPTGDAPDGTMAGRALLHRAPAGAGDGSRFRRAADSSSFAFAEESAFTTSEDGRRVTSDERQVALYDGAQKIIRSGRGVEVYDLTRDALEQTDLSRSDPIMRDRLRAEVDRFDGSLGGEGRASSHDVEETLRALGYVE
jgi:arylsulfatase A-like enzyme